MFKLVFFVPESHLDEVKCAVFEAGAGKMGGYDQCCWQSLGQGQFRPLKGATPYLGQENQLEYVDEYRVETVCPVGSIKQVISALKRAHPYEVPAFDVLTLSSHCL